MDAFTIGDVRGYRAWEREEKANVEVSGPAAAGTLDRPCCACSACTGRPPPPPVAGSAILMDCEGCWTHSIPIEDCDGDNCPLCGSSMLMEQGDQFDAAVWGGGCNRAYVPNAEGESRAASARTLHPLGSFEVPK